MFRHYLLWAGCAVALIGCFDDPADNTSGSSTETSGAESSTGTTTTEGEETETSSGETGDCMDAGCDCVEDDDCGAGLACIEGSCAAPLCGDAIANGDEQCDDGNALDGDGCDSDCSYTELLAVDAGGAHTCVLIEGGRVKCWGYNANGQLGLGHTLTIGDDELPSDVPDVELPLPAIQISTGLAEHTCALLDDQSIYCWGRNDAGQLGYGNVDDIGDDEAPASGGPVEIGVDAVEVEVGSFQTCARGADQTIHCWGLGFFGQLGYGNEASVGDDELPSAVGSVPVGGPVKGMAVGGSHTCALAVIGEVFCWGYNEFGALGYATVASVGDDETPADQGPAPVVPKGVPARTNASQLSAGVYNACARFETGEVLCWGDGSGGQLGQVSVENIGDDEPPSDLFPIDLPAAATHLSAGGSHVCVQLESGEGYCWGTGDFGQLGYGNVQDLGDDELPTAFGPLDVAGSLTQLDAGFFHTCAINEFNELRCWGNNDAGQLGQGHTDTLGNDELPADVPPISIF